MIIWAVLMLGDMRYKARDREVRCTYHASRAMSQKIIRYYEESRQKRVPKNAYKHLWTV